MDLALHCHQRKWTPKSGKLAAIVKSKPLLRGDCTTHSIVLCRRESRIAGRPETSPHHSYIASPNVRRVSRDRIHYVIINNFVWLQRNIIRTCSTNDMVSQYQFSGHCSQIPSNDVNMAWHIERTQAIDDIHAINYIFQDISCMFTTMSCRCAVIKEHELWHGPKEPMTTP